MGVAEGNDYGCRRTSFLAAQFLVVLAAILYLEVGWLKFEPNLAAIIACGVLP
jgi:hypothetical protein